MPTLTVERLTAAAFAPFGEVIAPESAKQVLGINAGTATRYHDLAHLDVESEGGRPLISWFRARPQALPLTLTQVERHPLGSQAFFPLTPHPYLVVVTHDPATVPRAFLAQPLQGVNYRRGLWHHALIALHAESNFLVIDRGGAGHNCDEVALAQAWQVTDLPA